MKYDRSYGIIPLRLHKEEWQALLVQHNAGHWAFPKGHAHVGESHHQAAERELHEETGLKVKEYLSQEVLQEQYLFRWKGELIEKLVIYFIARVEGKILLQQKEIQACQWLSLKDAEEQMSFEEGKKLCQELRKLSLVSSLTK